MGKHKRKHPRPASKKKKRMYTEDEVRFIRKIHSMKLIYLDNALLGFRSDEKDKKQCGEDFLRWVKGKNITTLISFINVYELRPLFIGKIVKLHPGISQNVLKTLTDFKPDIISEEDTIETAKRNKELWLFLTKKLKLGDYDAAHFTMAVAYGCDLFVSFNKRAFQENRKKIRNKLTELDMKMPEIWTLEDIKKNMEMDKRITGKYSGGQK